MRHFISLTSYQPHPGRNASSLLMLGAALGAERIDFDVRVLEQDPDFCHAMNALLTAHHDGRCDGDFLMIDSDMTFQARDALRLLRSPHDFVAANYPRKSLGAGMAGRLRSRQDGPCIVEADYLGTGFLKLSRRAVEALCAGRQWVADEHGGYYDVVRSGPRDGRFVDGGEALCRAWQDLGGTVWCDTSIKLGHIGAHEFREGA